MIVHVPPFGDFHTEPFFLCGLLMMLYLFFISTSYFSPRFYLFVVRKNRIISGLLLLLHVTFHIKLLAFEKTLIKSLHKTCARFAVLNLCVLLLPTLRYSHLFRIKLHQYLGYAVVIFGSLHAFLVTVHKLNTKHDLSFMFTSRYITGILFSAFLIGIILTSRHKIRRSQYQFFYRSHLICVLAIGVLVLFHPKPRYLFFWVPFSSVVIFVIIRWWRLIVGRVNYLIPKKRNDNRLQLLKFDILKSKHTTIVRLELEKSFLRTLRGDDEDDEEEEQEEEIGNRHSRSNIRNGFKFPDSYELYLYSRKLGMFEHHPFTLIEREDRAVLILKQYQGWTKRLTRFLEEYRIREGEKGTELIREEITSSGDDDDEDFEIQLLEKMSGLNRILGLRYHGVYPSGFGYGFCFSKLIFIGGGIGVIPTIACISQLIHYANCHGGMKNMMKKTNRLNIQIIIITRDELEEKVYTDELQDILTTSSLSTKRKKRRSRNSEEDSSQQIQKIELEKEEEEEGTNSPIRKYGNELLFWLDDLEIHTFVTSRDGRPNIHSVLDNLTKPGRTYGMYISGPEPLHVDVKKFLKSNSASSVHSFFLDPEF